jgi:hypothetical protein
MRSAIVEKDTKRDCKSLDIIILQTLSLVINLLVKISPYSKKEHENNSKAFEYANFYNDFFKKN